MDQMNSTNYGYTPDQIKEMQAAFKSNDITGAVSITPSVNMSTEKAKVYERTANVFSQYWLENLKELGMNGRQVLRAVHQARIALFVQVRRLFKA